MTGTSFYGVEKQADGLTGGSTQAETRLYNERLILSLVRRRGALSKVELARLTGLSAQTVSTIVNYLASSNLLVRGEPLRGRLGQPSVPFSLNPRGAFSFGLHIGRRHVDLVLSDFLGNVVGTQRLDYEYPQPHPVIAFARAAIPALLDQHRLVEAKRVTGIGIASPFEIWTWTDPDLPTGSLSAWQEVDVRAELDRALEWPVFLLSDAMMAAAAELMFGCGESAADFLSIYVGHIIGGGVVLDHRLFPGSNKRAGSIEAIPIPVGGQSRLLQEIASLRALAHRIGGLPDGLPETDADWAGRSDLVNGWVEEAADGIAVAIAATAALIDVNTAVVDGAVPGDVRHALVRAIRRRVAESLVARPEPFVILEGRFGDLAPALGAAAIPFLISYSNDRDVLFKDWSARAAKAAVVSVADRSVA